MIEIKFKKKGHEFVGYRVKGHAKFAKRGKDVVCAGVSAIAYTGINSLMTVAKISNLKHFVNEKGEIYCSLPTELSKGQKQKSQVILQSTLVGFKSIEITYKKYIKICIEEVQPKC